MKKQKYTILFLCALLLSLAAYAYSDGVINDPSFEIFASSSWNVYSTDDPPVTPAPIQAGCIGLGATFDLLFPAYVPDGGNVCGLQSSGDVKNGGVYQSFYWNGGLANIAVTARAYSTQLPENGGQPFDSGCRVRMALLPTTTSNPADVTDWVVFPWSSEWQTLKLRVPGPGEYTLFIEGVQPTAGMVSSTLWDNVVLTESQPVVVKEGPQAVINVDAPHPDTTMTIQWTTDVPSTSHIEYGTDASYGHVLLDYSLKTDHKVVLNNLTPSTTYHYCITSSAPDRSDFVSQDLVFGTPIQFSNVTATPTIDATNMLIKWTTDVPTISQVAYGENACNQFSTEDTQLTTNHSLILAGLDEDKDYNYQIIGRNQPAYTDAISPVFVLHTLPSPKDTLENGSFEQLRSGVHSAFPWVKYDTVIAGSGVNSIDGLVDAPYPKEYADVCPISIQPYDGSYFLGAAAYFDFKNGGVFQRVKYPAGKLCTLAARYLTYSLGGSQTDTVLRLGIDPDGGTDPLSSSVKWWTVASPTNDSQWHPASVSAKAGDNGVITVFLDIVQQWSIPWHIVAIDDVSLGTPATVSIGQLKSSTTNLNAVLENEIITCVEDTSVPYGNSSYKKAYMQDENRTSGICVLFDPQKGVVPAAGNKVTVTGYLEVFNKEAFFIASDWKSDGVINTLPDPLAMCQRSVGGCTANQQALYASKGLCNVGLRVRLFGRVCDAGLPPEGNPSGTDSTVYFDDGSKLLDHTPIDGSDPVYGIRAQLKGNPDYGIKPGDYLTVTGVLSIEEVDPDGRSDSGDEYYAYTVVTNSGDDWSVASSGS